MFWIGFNYPLLKSILNPLLKSNSNFCLKTVQFSGNLSEADVLDWISGQVAPCLLRASKTPSPSFNTPIIGDDDDLQNHWPVLKTVLREGVE